MITKNLYIYLLLCVFSFLPITHAKASVTKIECTVITVTDGDTLKARCNLNQKENNTITVRLRDLDAPERDQPFGDESRESLKQLCLNQIASLEVYTNNQEIERDKYNRVLARVSCQNKNASQYQIEQGMAWVYRCYLDEHSNASELLTLETIAKKNQVGLWQDSDNMAPWQWRRN